MKKSILSMIVLSTFSTQASDFVTIINSNEVIYISGKLVETTEWINEGGLYNCSIWSPSVDSVNFREEFTQNRSCSQDQTRDVNTYTVDQDGNKVLDKTEKENKTISIPESQQAIGTFDDTTGYIVMLRSQNKQSSLDAMDVTKTTHPLWEEHFGKTHDIVVNGVSLANIPVTTTGVVNWFNPNKKYTTYISEGCSSADQTHVDMEFLDENDNVLGWFDTRTNPDKNYAVRVRYGKLADKSDATVTGETGSYPNMSGYFSFDVDNNSVNFINTKTTHYTNNWSITGVNVNDIRKLRVSHSYVVGTYAPGDCGANVQILIENFE
jgi:hypothetical protein